MRNRSSLQKEIPLYTTDVYFIANKRLTSTSLLPPAAGKVTKLPRNISNIGLNLIQVYLDGRLPNWGGKWDANYCMWISLNGPLYCCKWYKGNWKDKVTLNLKLKPFSKEKDTYLCNLYQGLKKRNSTTVVNLMEYSAYVSSIIFCCKMK